MKRFANYVVTGMIETLVHARSAAEAKKIAESKGIDVRGTPVRESEDSPVGERGRPAPVAIAGIYPL